MAHVFTSDLSLEFPTMFQWIAEKMDNKHALAICDNKDPEHTEFSSFYDTWMNEFKITHVITEEGEEPKVISYKSLSAERIAFALNVVNTITTGKELPTT
jgi:hypothetical protein